MARLASISLSSATSASVFSSCALHWQVVSVRRQYALCRESAFAMESSRAFARATVSTGAFALSATALAESAGAPGAAGAAACGVAACGVAAWGVAAWGVAAESPGAGSVSIIIMSAGSSFLRLPPHSLQRLVHSIDIGAMGSRLRRRVRESTVAFAALMALGCMLSARCSASPDLEMSSNRESVVRPFSMFL